MVPKYKIYTENKVRKEEKPHGNPPSKEDVDKKTRKSPLKSPHA